MRALVEREENIAVERKQFLRDLRRAKTTSALQFIDGLRAKLISVDRAFDLFARWIQEGTIWLRERFEKLQAFRDKDLYASHNCTF